MAFSSSTVTIGHSTKKADYDRLLDNAQYNKSTVTVHAALTDIHTPVTISTATATGGSDGDVWFTIES